MWNVVEIFIASSELSTTLVSIDNSLLVTCQCHSLSVYSLLALLP